MQSRGSLEALELKKYIKAKCKWLPQSVWPDTRRKEALGMAEHGCEKKIIQGEEMISLIQFQSCFFDFCSLLAGIIIALDEQKIKPSNTISLCLQMQQSKNNSNSKTRTCIKEW